MKHVAGDQRANGQVVTDDVVGLNTVLDEEVVAADSIAHIVLHCEEVDAVDSDNTGKGIVHCVAAHKRGGHFSSHVEVDAISAQDGGLAAVEELRVGDLSLSSVD